jgi:hypothetical protein
MASVWEGIVHRRGISPVDHDPWGDRFEEIRGSSEYTPDIDFDPEASWSEVDEEASPRKGFNDEFDPDRKSRGRLVRPEELAEEHEGEAAGSFKRRGFEAIAWYAPISLFGAQYWGIYFHEPRFWGYCRRLQGLLGAPTLRDVARDLYRMVDRHESFHAAVELFALMSQDLGGAPGLSSGESLYGKYFNSPAPVGYRDTYGTPDCIEESLATAAQFRHLKPRVTGLRAVVEAELQKAPHGYREWTNFSDSRKFRAGLVDLTANRILSQTVGGAAHVKALTTGSKNSRRKIAVGWWFPRPSPKGLSSFGRIPHYATRHQGVYTKLFPPSILGSRKMRDVRREAKRLYQATVSDGHAKHAKQLVFPNGKVVPLPNTPGVPHYVIEQIAKALDKPKQEVLRELNFL